MEKTQFFLMQILLILYAPRTGQLDFTVPGMGHYIQRVSNGR